MKLIITEAITDDLQKVKNNPQAMHDLMKAELEGLRNPSLTSVVSGSKGDGRSAGSRLIDTCIEVAMSHPRAWNTVSQVLKVAPITNLTARDCIVSLAEFISGHSDFKLSDEGTLDLLKSNEMWKGSAKEFEAKLKAHYDKVRSKGESEHLADIDDDPKAVYNAVVGILTELGNPKLDALIKDSKIGDKTIGTRLINLCIEASLEKPQVWEKIKKILAVAPLKKSMDIECVNVLINFLIQYPNCDYDGKVMSPIWKSAELWDCTRKEFDYVIRIFYNISDSSLVRKNFDYPSVVKPQELWQGNKVGGKLKRPGIVTKDPYDLQTIYGTVESWDRASKAATGTGDNSRSSTGTKKRASKTFSTFDDATKAGHNRNGNVVHIDGDFTWNDKSKRWVPVED